MALVPSRHAAGGSLRPVDYLFESLDVDESAGNGDDAVSQALEQPADENRWSRRIVLAGVVLATLAGTAGIHSGRIHPAVRDGAGGGVHCYADHDRSTRSCLARHGQHTCHQNLGGDTYR
jgi:hypothetical protein